MFCFFSVNLRPSSPRLTCGFCAQNMKVQFIPNCIWAKCEYLFLFSGYMVCNFTNENKELSILFRGRESFQ